MTEPPFILVVDDEPRGARFLARLLRALGDVEPATSGAEGWEIVQRRCPDVVVSDQRMPGLSGVEFLARVAGHDPHVGRVILTGYADLEATVESINQGRVHAYLHKPCDPGILRTTVKNLIERAQISRQNAQLLSSLRAKNAELLEALHDLKAAQARVVHAERLSVIGRMAAMIAHDFRGPLTVLHSVAAEVARSAGELPVEELRELGATGLEESRRLDRMCAELLEATRGTAEAPHHEEHDLDALVDEAAGRLAVDAGACGVRVETRLESGARVHADAGRIHRALFNLAANAFEAMPDGGTLRLATTRRDGWARIAVADDGVGIPDAIRDRLFEPFVTCGKASGTGLGLAVVKQVVEEHGGAVAVEKGDGGGTVFQLDLPCREAG